MAQGANPLSVLYVVRHGQASFMTDNYDRLSDLGRRQAALVGQSWAAQGLRLDAAYCGTQSRQRDTAREALALLNDPPPLTEMPEFNEYESEAIIAHLAPGLAAERPELAEQLPRMRSDRRAFQAVYEAVMLRWIAGRHDDAGPEAIEHERWRDFLARFERGLAQVRAANGRGKAVAVFTSGGPISAVMRLALGLSDEAALRLTWTTRNAAVSSFLYNDASLTLARFNCTGHLEGQGDPALLTYR